MSSPEPRYLAHRLPDGGYGVFDREAHRFLEDPEPEGDHALDLDGPTWDYGTLRRAERMADALNQDPLAQERVLWEREAAVELAHLLMAANAWNDGTVSGDELRARIAAWRAACRKAEQGLSLQ